MRKTISLLILLIFGITTTLSAQQMRKERIKAFRAAVFVEELQLTEEEAADFFPIYNAFDQEQEALKKELRQARRNIELVADADVKTHIEKMFEIEEQQIDLKRKYFNRFMEVLPVRKVLRIHKAEQEFRKLLLEKLKERRDD
ncbi:MAG: hypothetical protein AAF806_00290 [Bacteroidota bacterium]